MVSFLRQNVHEIKHTLLSGKLRGSILKGETAAEGAVRELYEETGIKISTEDLIVLYSYVDKPKHAIYAVTLI
ncbi:MAG: NUDIX domain-containing protein [Lachnospira eligens]